MVFTLGHLPNYGRRTFVAQHIDELWNMQGVVDPNSTFLRQHIPREKRSLHRLLHFLFASSKRLTIDFTGAVSVDGPFQKPLYRQMGHILTDNFKLHDLRHLSWQKQLLNRNLKYKQLLLHQRYYNETLDQISQCGFRNHTCWLLQNGHQVQVFGSTLEIETIP